MKNIKKLLVLLLVASMVMSMAACKGNTDPSDSTGIGNVSGQTATYNVTVQSAGKLALEGISVEVYEDNTMKNLVNVATTNADGKVSFTMAESADYAIKLSNVKNGYQTQDSYTFTGGTTTITLASELIEGESMSGASFQLGDVMYDFEITNTDGNTVKLSELLAEKDMVLLNVFYTTCSPCNAEMPYMQEAYEQFQEDVGIIAITPYGSDNNAKAAAFKADHGLTFDVAKVPNGWGTLAVDSAYPTSYVIDRYGVVCLIEVGALTSLRPFVSIFEHFTADNYETKLVTNLEDIVTQVKPTVERTDPEQIAAVLGNAEGNIVYRNEEDSEYCWPFTAADYNGETVFKASNSTIEGSYSILYVDVTLKAGQAIGFDYLVSSESGADIFHVIVDETPIYSISGVDEVPTWNSCYPWVAPKDGTYKVGLTYIKDDSDNYGDDTVYLKNFRILDSSQIDSESYIPMEAAISSDGFNFEYVEIVYNEVDGYYHVGTANGPLLLANLMTVSQFNEENSIYLMALDGTFGDTMAERITPFASYASNSKLSNYCTVTKELAELLKECVDIAGFEDNDSEWLKLCKYYAAYGTNGKQMEDPIAGLASFSALPAQEGMNEMPFLEGILIMPRGKLAKFVPSRSGVYRITSHDNGEVETAFMNAWIFDEDHNIIHEAMNDERVYTADNYNPNSDITMTFYMEAGKAYYIGIAYWDPYTVGVIPYSITYEGASYQSFIMCSPGAFTYNSDATGDNIYEIIHGGIDAVLNPADGLYHHDMGKDEAGNQIYGSVIYADFSGYSIIDHPIAGVGGLIDLGAFDFSKSEDDMVVLQYMKTYENDREKVEEALIAHWGEENFTDNQKLIDDVFDGIYHGAGNDETAAISAYLSKMLSGGVEDGCVPVDEELARILQLLMDKFTFDGVYQSWLKLCYYYKSV